MNGHHNLGSPPFANPWLPQNQALMPPPQPNFSALQLSPRGQMLGPFQAANNFGPPYPAIAPPGLDQASLIKHHNQQQAALNAHFASMAAAHHGYHPSILGSAGILASPPPSMPQGMHHPHQQQSHHQHFAPQHLFPPATPPQQTSQSLHTTPTKENHPSTLPPFVHHQQQIPPTSAPLATPKPPPTSVSSPLSEASPSDNSNQVPIPRAHPHDTPPTTSSEEHEEDENHHHHQPPFVGKQLSSTVDQTPSPDSSSANEEIKKEIVEPNEISVAPPVTDDKPTENFVPEKVEGGDESMTMKSTEFDAKMKQEDDQCEDVNMEDDDEEMLEESSLLLDETANNEIPPEALDQSITIHGTPIKEAPSSSSSDRATEAIDAVIQAAMNGELEMDMESRSNRKRPMAGKAHSEDSGTAIGCHTTGTPSTVGTSDDLHHGRIPPESPDLHNVSVESASDESDGPQKYYISGPENEDDAKQTYFCHLCSYSGTSKFHFNSHMNSHFEHQCPTCDYTSRTEGRLKRHLKDFHSDVPPPNFSGGKTVRSGRPKNYRCKQCDYIAGNKTDFWEHSRVHIKVDKVLQCPKCSFVTEYKHHLEYHLRNHFGSKPFRCSKCNYSCVNKSMLNSHMKSHTNIYQYRCSNCSYATKYCHSLKLHLKKYDHKAATVLNSDGSVIEGLEGVVVPHPGGSGKSPKNTSSTGTPSRGDQGSPSRSVNTPASFRETPTRQRSPQNKRPKLEKSPSHNQPSNILPNAIQQPNQPQFNIAPTGPQDVNALVNNYWAIMKRGNMLQNPAQSQLLSIPPLNTLMPPTNGPLSQHPPQQQGPAPTVKCNLCGFMAVTWQEVAQHVIKTHATENSDLLRAFGVSSDVLAELRKTMLPAPPGQPTGLLVPSGSGSGHDSRPLNSGSSFSCPSPNGANGVPLDLSSAKTKSSSGSPGLRSSETPSTDGDEHPHHQMSSNRKRSRKGKAVKLSNLRLSQLYGLHTSNTQHGGEESEERLSHPSGETPHPRSSSSDQPHSSRHSGASGSSPTHPSATHHPYECVHCEITFKDEIMYSIHMSHHAFGPTSAEAFVCRLCGERLRDKVEFYLHIVRTSHDLPASISPEEDPEDHNTSPPATHNDNENQQATVKEEHQIASEEKICDVIPSRTEETSIPQPPTSCPIASES